MATFEWEFENTKYHPLAHPSESATSAYERMGYGIADFYEHFPCFVGAAYLARFISLYDAIKIHLGFQAILPK